MNVDANEATAEVEAEPAERSRDKGRRHERMAEVERGAESIIQGLGAKSRESRGCCTAIPPRRTGCSRSWRRR